ncbi:MAG: hypothetical protein M5U34_12895 [Chloroflexi bacterium]|nr:hypothetical protein [Chloroflexota bacterium]
MNVLDENIIDNQRRQLMSWRMRIHQIGFEVGRKGMKDREVIPFASTQTTYLFHP